MWPFGKAEPPLTKASRKPMSTNAVPAALHGLLPVVKRWGAVRSDSERYDVAKFAEQSDQHIEELERWAKIWTPEMQNVFDEWEGRTRLTDSYELCKFSFLLLMLDELEIECPAFDKDIDHLPALIADLKVFDRIGAVAKRTFAARSLCQLEDEGRPAIEALQAATGDPEDEVKVWAHAALAIITREMEPHRRAMDAIAKSGTETRIFGIPAAFEELKKSSESRLLSRLTEAAIMNDVTEIRKIIGRVDVNLTDHNDTPAIAYAVGNGQVEALRLLLEAGGDPNSRDCQGRTLLHMAASRRRGPLLIPLLLEHGSDPDLKDRQGRTALDLARECGRQKNAELLENAGH